MQDPAISQVTSEEVRIEVEVEVSGIEIGGEALLLETGTGISSQLVLEVDLVRAGESANLIEEGISDQMLTGTSDPNAETTIGHSREIFAVGIMTSGRGTIRQVAVVLGTEQPHQERCRR